MHKIKEVSFHEMYKVKISAPTFFPTGDVIYKKLALSLLMNFEAQFHDVASCFLGPLRK